MFKKLLLGLLMFCPTALFAQREVAANIWNGSAWTPLTSSGTTNPTPDGALPSVNLMCWNGSNWVNADSTCLSGGGSAYNPAAVAITGGTIAVSSLSTATTPNANVLYYGADATGVVDAKTAFANSGSATAFGISRNIYAPKGTYHITDQITLLPNQCLIGDPDGGTFIDISTDFSTTANGVVVVSPTNNAANVKPCIENITIQFHQPPDLVTTTTQSTAATGNTITVASATGIINGDYVYDATTPASISNQGSGLVTGLTTVTNVTGNVITISNAVIGAGVGNGDSIHFAQPRANFTTLAGGCSLTAGAPGCKYPYAIYNNGAQEMTYRHVLVLGAWDGIFQRGQSYVTQDVKVGALDKGFDQDTSANFSTGDYEFWSFGLGFNSGINATNQAFGQIYYDGNTVCANLGRNDGVNFTTFQCWVGKLNITTAWTFGHFGSLMMDGLYANLNIQGATSSWLQIDNMYSTKGLSPDTTPAITATSNSTVINNLQLNTKASGPTTAGILVNGGSLTINGGRLITSASGLQLALVSSGTLAINNGDFKTAACAAVTNGFIQQSGGILAVNGRFEDNCTGDVAINSNTDVAGNDINVLLNGWTFTPPGAIGTYVSSNGGTTTFRNPIIDNYSGTASTPGLELSGTPFAGTNANSFGTLDVTWGAAASIITLNTAGTGITERAPTGSTADLINLFTGTQSEFKVSSGGNGTYNGSLTGVSFNSTAGQTTVGCSTSGNAIFSEPARGASEKRVIIHLAACLGTASYTYATAFTNAPSCYASSLVACSVAGSPSTTAVTVTGTTSTGSLMLADY